ncbi:MAG TPA: lipopolysaccharide assembly protein LapA domain-containing protein [Mycobacterium sp.]|jgi:uncharacterized integral membrane protein|nr:lipopolysaccharide assembly protein LapA domain-containing protein [Mycobacterium sp.]
MTSESSVPDRPLGATPLPGEPVPPPAGDVAGVPTEPAPPPRNAVHFTRAAALWSALIGGFLILILLLVFIMQNTNSITINFFGWNWNLPLGVAILLSAVGGGLLTVAVGTVRIVQLRRAAKKNLKARI